MGCSTYVALYDADKVDALGGKCGRFTRQIERVPGIVEHRLYVEVSPCLCGNIRGGDHRDDDGVCFPDDVTEDQISECIIWSEEEFEDGS